MSPRPVASIAFVAGVVIVLPVYFTLSTAVQSIVFDVVAVAAAVAMFAGEAWHGGEPRSAWRLLGVAVASWALGDIVFGESQPVPSLADMFYVVGYPLMALGLLGLGRSTPRRTNSSPLADALLIASAIVVVTMVMLLVPESHAEGVGLAGKTLSLSYPAMDVVLLGLVLRDVRSGVAWRVPLQLLCVAFAFQLVADSGYSLQAFGTGYTVGNVTDVAFLMAYAFLAAAVLHPAIAPAGDVVRRRKSWDRGAVVEEGIRGHVIVSTRSAPVALRFDRVLRQVGTLLFAVGVASLFLGIAWRAPDIMLVSAGYLLMGTTTLVARA